MIKYIPEVHLFSLSLNPWRVQFIPEAMPDKFHFFFSVLPFQVLFPSYPQLLNYLNL